jgi:phospholipid/cholesterol/gamma-HCH transport system substrate-binding protein
MFRSIELTVGAFVGIGLAALFMLAMQASNLSSFTSDGQYELTARFDNIGGLKVKSAVKVSGVKVGQVSAIDYDMETFEAVVTMRINDQYDRFPKDTIASIFTSGLLGEQYVGLEPGGDDQVLADSSEIRHTQSAMVLEQIIGQFLFSKSQDNGNNEGF